jgi:hypothetical protein
MKIIARAYEKHPSGYVCQLLGDDAVFPYRPGEWVKYMPETRTARTMRLCRAVNRPACRAVPPHIMPGDL